MGTIRIKSGLAEAFAAWFGGSKSKNRSKGDLLKSAVEDYFQKQAQGNIGVALAESENKEQPAVASQQAQTQQTAPPVGPTPEQFMPPPPFGFPPPFPMPPPMGGMVPGPWQPIPPPGAFGPQSGLVNPSAPPVGFTPSDFEGAARRAFPLVFEESPQGSPYLDAAMRAYSYRSRQARDIMNQMNFIINSGRANTLSGRLALQRLEQRLKDQEHFMQRALQTNKLSHDNYIAYYNALVDNNPNEAKEAFERVAFQGALLASDFRKNYYPGEKPPQPDYYTAREVAHRARMHYASQRNLNPEEKERAWSSIKYNLSRLSAAMRRRGTPPEHIKQYQQQVLSNLKTYAAGLEDTPIGHILTPNELDILGLRVDAKKPVKEVLSGVGTAPAQEQPQQPAPKVEKREKPKQEPLWT